MTKRYGILRKKLKEVASELTNLLSLPLDDDQSSTPPCHHLLHCQDIEQRLGFVKTLLSAEIASHPSKPQHLKHMSTRVAELETISREYCNSFSLTSAAVDQYHVDHDHEDADSTCSCTESCLIDDGVASADLTDQSSPSPRYEEREGGNYSDHVEEEGWVEEDDYKELPMPVVVFSSEYHDENNNGKGKVIDDDDERDRVAMKRSSSSSEVIRQSGSGVGVGMMCGAVVTGWLLGVVSMGMVFMVGLSSSGLLFQFEEQYGNFLTPT